MKVLFESIVDMLRNPYIILIILAIVIPKIVERIRYQKRKKEYEESTYYQITGTEYAHMRNDAGKVGEYLIYKTLKSYENESGKFLFNLYLPKEEDETTEIDVVFISSKGIFVFESKNYSGWIFGDEKQAFWMQTLPTGRNRSQKEKFYNPIMQNKKHIQYLEKCIGEEIPLFSVVVFSDKCTFKKMNIQNTDTKVIHNIELYSLMNDIFNTKPDTLNINQVKEIYDVLYPFSQVSNETKEKHIKKIEENIRTR